MGDYNIDMYCLNEHSATNEFVENLFSHMFLPLISMPTRITAHSATLIDNIFTNHLTQNLFSGIIINDLSDHLPVFVYVFTETPPPCKSSEKIILRDFGDSNITKFRTHLTNVNWENLSNQDVDSAFDAFQCEFSRLYDLSFPPKSVRTKNSNKPLTPWMTRGLLTCVRKKNKLYKKFIISRSPDKERQYKIYKNKLTNLIKIAKKTYYENKFETAKNDHKTTWKLINEVINKRRTKTSLPSSFISNNTLLSDPKDIANRFCKYFANIGPDLASKIQETSNSFLSFLNSNNEESISLHPTNPNELLEICNSFKTAKAPGYDNLSMYVIKKSIDLIVEPLVNVINLSLSKGVFPSKLKIAKIIPIFKTGNQSFFTNYRPISLLTNFSKLFEKVMQIRLTLFIEQCEILYRFQFGFRSNHSTMHSLVSLINNVATAIDRNQIAAGVFIDLSKAFDTLDHEILFTKLQHYGIRGVALQWIKSYFCNREQFVQYNETCSTMEKLKCGVPQGSILGPLFFILYINDLPNALELSKSYLFADDTSIYYSNSDIKQLEFVLNSELRKLDIWMKSNKLSVNISKTNYIIFRPRQKKINSNLVIQYNNQTITQKQYIKFLGVYLDEHLSWKEHINYICNKIAKSVGIIYRSRYLLSSATRLSLYYTLIYPYLTYCNIVWSSTYVTNLNRILLLQKRAVRILTNSEYRAHSDPLFKQLKILDIFKLNLFHIGKFMFLYHHCMLPTCFDELFITNNQIHGYNTRSAGNYRSHACRTNIKQFTILYSGPNIWNSLPTNITVINTISSFKTQLRNFLLNE